MTQPQTVASKVFRQIRTTVTMGGVFLVVKWLLDHAGVYVVFSTTGVGRCLGVLHKDNHPENDEFINIDIRVMGQTVLLGWIQIL